MTERSTLDEMTADQMVVVDWHGNVLEGTLRLSSHMCTHIVLDHAFPDCRGMCHTLSRSAAAWAQAGKDIPALGSTHADYFYGQIPCTRAIEPEKIAEMAKMPITGKLQRRKQIE